MKICGQKWRDMKPEQKRKLIRQKVVDNRDMVVEVQWKAMLKENKPMFRLCAEAHRLSSRVLVKS
ncbi:hypothetical protein P4278_31190 [Bacillus thuringiensis]|uniref:Uncharacterized protein n=1 Tax=Bacillus thuringiensis subsp. tolworthi TaxID=1442 RepID=A0A9W4ESK4_BACTO|nr:MULTISPECIES: hypothetical protein [Bacillus cereus group]MEB8715956.1 hypothetical protein [Bacillus cereus]MED2074824.1 hypothetical protein [Bacillus thuringiensis]KIP29346.1 hypothetical protein BG10_913 [Bacillus thuringiensis serovar morrisoni]MEB9430835.1 hypothetical protein [Bacillus cereus]MEB9478144.1 hypothetical protein [Bacillus cereus]